MRCIELLAATMTMGLVSACSSARDAPFSPTQEPRVIAALEPSAPASAENYVWARADGQRMATNPELLRQGRADQARCRQSAQTSNGALDLPVFSGCMEASGYVRMGQPAPQRG